MAKTKISEFDSTPANNTDIDSINIAEGCAPSGINNAIRELMSQLKDQQTGASADNFTVGGNLAVTGTSAFTGTSTFTGAVTFSSTVVLSTALPVASGGTGSSTAGGARTSLGAAASGANSDITSITGLTTALTVAQGGTGAATHTSKGVLIGNGTSAVTTVSPGTIGNVLTSDGTNWASSAPAGGVGKSGTSWNNVSGSRAIGTAYTNANSYPIQVNAGVAGSGINATTSAILTVGGVTVASNKVVVGNGIGSDCICAVSAIIPPSASYTLTGTGTLSYWAELY
jgi:hypothetical protein